MSFESLGLSEALLRAVADAGYTTPTPIQLQAIPAVLSGGDLMAGAQTGTGKTAGFVLPILQRLSTTPRAAGPAGKTPVRVLILTPTRELAAQVEESVRTYGKHLKISSTVIFGGVGINPQISALRRGVDIVVATPGRLLDHHGQRTIDLSKVEVLVLDEADRMLDMGFIPDIKRIIATLPKQRQNLLFSATFSDEIRDLAKGMLRSPALVQATPRNSTVEAVAQRVHPVDAKRKAELLIHLVKEHQWFQVLVFTRTKHGANKLSLQLEKSGISSQAIHGNKSQNARTKALAEFKDSKLQVLVATDIAARGLDIEQLPHVVNFDLPNVPEDYVHRIGRTGRAGATGEAISLVSPEEMGLLRDIERVTRRPITRSVVAGFEAGSRSSASDHAALHELDDTRRAPASRPRSSASRSSGNGERARRPAGSRAPAAGNHAAGPGSRAPSAAGRPARGDGAPRADGASSAAPRGAGAPSRSGSAPRGNSSAPSRSSSSSSRRPEVDPNVRANLPPGWSMASSGRRGR